RWPSATRRSGLTRSIGAFVVSWMRRLVWVRPRAAARTGPSGGKPFGHHLPERIFLRTQIRCSGTPLPERARAGGVRSAASSGAFGRVDEEAAGGFAPGRVMVFPRNKDAVFRPFLDDAAAGFFCQAGHVFEHDFPSSTSCCGVIVGIAVTVRKSGVDFVEDGV